MSYPFELPPPVAVEEPVMALSETSEAFARRVQRALAEEER